MSITWDPRVLHARDMSDLYDSLCTQPTQKWFFSDFFASRFALQYCLEAFALQMVFLAKETVVLGARKILHLSGKEVSLSLEPWTYSFRKTVLYAKAFFITLAATFLLLFGYEPLAWYNLEFQYKAGLFTNSRIAGGLDMHKRALPNLQFLWFTEESLIGRYTIYNPPQYIYDSHEALRSAVIALTKTASIIPNTQRYGSKEAQAAIKHVEEVIATLPLSKFSKLL